MFDIQLSHSFHLDSDVVDSSIVVSSLFVADLVRSQLQQDFAQAKETATAAVFGEVSSVFFGSF